VAALPIAQGRDRDAQFIRELLLGEAEPAANLAHVVQWRQELGRRRQIRVLGDHPLDIGVGKARAFPASNCPFSAIAWSRVFRMIIKASHSNAPAAPK
jgi:hypothetical protein